MSNATELLYESNQRSQVTRILPARILTVDSLNSKAGIESSSEGYTIKKDVDLPTYCSPSGIGLRFTPLVDSEEANSIVLYQEAGEYISMGYVSVNTALIDNKDNTKNAVSIPLRYLQPGEVSLRAQRGNELFLDRQGGVLLADHFYNSIRINPDESAIILKSANYRGEFDGVRIRSGNVRRPVYPHDLDETYVVTADAIQDKEFMVQVGTQVDASGQDTDKPDVGFMCLGSKVYDEYGRLFKLGEDNAQFLIKTTGGGGIGISDKGDIYFLDYAGGNSTVFKAGATGEKWFRSGNAHIGISSSIGITMQSNTGSSIELNNEHGVIIADASGRSIQVNDYGITLNAPGDGTAISYLASNHNFIGACNIGVLPMYGLLRAELFAAIYDAHVHPGPGSPPAVSLTMLLTQLMAMGIKVT